MTTHTTRKNRPSKTYDRPRLGPALRSIQQARNLSLQEVAQATEISASFLSLVENEKSDITIGRLVRLVNYFGITLADLIPTEAHDTDPEVVHQPEQRHIRSPVEGIDVYLLTLDTERAMMPMLLDFAPGAGLAEYGRHEGEEWVYVMEGRLRLILEGAEPRHLEAGDSAYYRATRPHLFENAHAKRRLRLLCVDSPPNL